MKASDEKNSSIVLRALNSEDAAMTAAFRSDPDARAHFLGNVYPNSEELEKKWIMGLPGLEPGTVTMGVENREGVLVGFIQLKNIHYQARHCEFAILIGRPHRGQSYGRQATQQALAYAFDTLNLNKVYLYVADTNAAAIGLYDSLGFKEAGRLTDHVYRNGTYHDLIIMEKIRKS